MKTTKKILPVLILSVCALLPAPLASRAQETNSATTNSVQWAQTEVISNAPEVEATNEAGMPAATTNEASPSESSSSTADSGSGRNPQPIVLFGQDALLKSNETADAVVVIGGSATVHGRVHDAVVVIGGNLEVDGDVGDAVVAIFGNVHVKPGAKIQNDAVAVMGTVTAAPGTKIGGDTVAIGGKLDIADGASVKGQKVNVGLPDPLGDIQWLKDWFRYCVLELRPLAPQVGFVWVIAAVFFLIYLLIAAVFTHPVQVCVDDLNRRPATIFLMGLLTKLLVPFVYLILAATGVGLIVAPIIGVALMLCAIVGKVAVIEWLGSRIGHNFGGAFQKPVVAFLLGIIVITLLYMVPVVGFLTFVILAVWGLGSGVTAAFARLRREAPENPTPPAPPSAPAPASPVAPMSAATPPVIGADVPPMPGASAILESSIPPGTPPPPQNAPQSQPSAGAPPFPDVSFFPKASLFERLCAAFLDIILIGILSGIAHAMPVCLIVALGYFAGMWAWKGTTIGGIVLKLKVIRTDGSPLTFVVALVRGLAAAFSAVIFFLGFLWIAWDKNKQGWHDKIAGTEVVRQPHATPLVVL